MRTVLTGIKRFIVRFLLFYWVCFMFPFPFDLVGLPFQVVPQKYQPTWLVEAGEVYSKGYMWVSNTKGDVCKRIGKEWLDVEVIIQPTGSGDTMRAYVGCFCAGVIALVLTCVCSAVHSLLRLMGKSFQAGLRLHALVRVIVRFYLMQMLFGYGFAKIYPMQFPEPTYRLSQQFGDFSPMGLLWAFMGFSPIYQMFTGTVEVLGGLLLSTRRTTFLGALVTIVAMTQIFALNMCFDVPVKLYSLHYLVMAVFLAAPDMPRLYRAMVLYQAAPPVPLLPLFGSVRLDRTLVVLRTLLVGALLWTNIYFGYVRYSDAYGGPPAPIQGRWETESVEVDGKEADKESSLTWKAWDFSLKGMVRIYGQKPPALSYRTEWQTEENRITLKKFSDPQWKASFNYALQESDKLEMTGSMDGKAIKARFKRAPDKKHELTNRGFHWIQEMPYNR
jgi:hypothetical protein